MARLKNDPGITKTNNEPIMTKPHWVDCNIKWLRNLNSYCLIVMFRVKSCSSVQKNFLRGLSLVVEREEATRRRSSPSLGVFQDVFENLVKNRLSTFLEKGGFLKVRLVLSELFNSPLLQFSMYVSGLSVCIFVALWLCMFGCLLQGPIRLKVL